VLRDQRSGYVRVCGHRLYYETYGFDDHGTVLVVPGRPGLDHQYLHSIADLAPFGYRVAFYDPLGCGRSEQPRNVAECSFRNSVEEVEGVRRVLRASGPLHLLGHSYGGRVALEAAVQNPGQFASLVLFSPSVRLPEVESIWNTARLPPKARAFLTRKSPKFEDIWEPGPKSGYRRYREGYEIFTRLRVCRMKVPPQDLVHTMQHSSSKVATAIIRSEKAYYGASSPEETALLYEKLKVPCLLTVGRYDQLSASSIRALQRRIPRSRMVVFDHSSHLANWEERERFTETLDRFLRRLS
jgi:proline iminopeptidase